MPCFLLTELGLPRSLRNTDKRVSHLYSLLWLPVLVWVKFITYIVSMLIISDLFYPSPFAARYTLELKARRWAAEHSPGQAVSA